MHNMARVPHAAAYLPPEPLLLASWAALLCAVLLCAMGWLLARQGQAVGKAMRVTRWVVGIAALWGLGFSVGTLKLYLYYYGKPDYQPTYFNGADLNSLFQQIPVVTAIAWGTAIGTGLILLAGGAMALATRQARERAGTRV